jgi:hypothetical protein
MLRPVALWGDRNPRHQIEAEQPRCQLAFTSLWVWSCLSSEITGVARYALLAIRDGLATAYEVLWGVGLL